MAEISKFFNSAPNDPRRYQASDFAAYFGDVLSDGLLHTNKTPGFVVTVGTGLNTIVGSGKAIIQGYAYENTSDLTLEHSLPETELDRIDRIVLRLDKRNQSRFIRLFVVTGESSANPVPPELTRDEFIFELSLAQIRVRANTASLLPTDLIDERLDDELCGLVQSLITLPTKQFQEQWYEFFNDITRDTSNDKTKYEEDWREWLYNQKREGFVTQDELYGGEDQTSILYRGENLVEVDRETPYSVESLEGKTEVQLVPPFDSVAWYRDYGLNVIVDPNDSRKAELVILPAGGQTGFGSFPVVGGNTYDVHFDFVLPEHATLRFEIAEYNKGEILPHKEHIITETSGVFTFTTEPSTATLSLHLDDQQVYSFLVNKLLIVNSGQEPSYVDGIQPIRFPSLKITDIEGAELSRLSVQDYFYEGDRLEVCDDRLVKVAKYKELILTGEERYVQVGFNNPISGVKRISIQNFVHDYNAIPNSLDITAVRPDSKILVTDTYENVIGPDMVGLGDNHLVLSIANEDSGWGDSYNPSLLEIRAYFMGWKMYNRSSGTSAYNTIYNGTGTKGWCRRGETTGQFASGTDTLPSTPVPTNLKWKPYRLVYKLLVEEVSNVQTFGELKLDKGANNIEITEGMVVGEIAKPYNGTSNKRVGIINSTYNDESISTLSNPVLKILGIYKNGVRDNSWVIQTTNAFGKERARTELYDQSAIYTVDYIIMPLDSASIESVTINYPLNIGSIMDELVTKTAKNVGDISNIDKRLSHMMSNGEPIEWHDLVLLNGVEPYSDTAYYRPRYARIGNFLVIVGALKGITTTSDFTVSVLPTGFRPLQNWGYSKPTSIKGSNRTRLARWQISSTTGSIRLEAVSDNVSASTDWYPIDVVMIGE